MVARPDPGYDRKPFSFEFESKIGWRYVVGATDDLKVWKQVHMLQADSKNT